jgi:hypothetical protein
VPQNQSHSCAGVSFWLSLAAFALVILHTARSLTPSLHGIGTHTQLGLPPCGFLRWAGLPCPACGLTSCFALLSRGSLQAGVDSHPVGALLFTLTCLSIPLSLAAALRGVCPAKALESAHLRHVCITLAVALLTQWLLRVLRYALLH